MCKAVSYCSFITISFRYCVSYNRGLGPIKGRIYLLKYNTRNGRPPSLRAAILSQTPLPLIADQLSCTNLEGVGVVKRQSTAADVNIEYENKAMVYLQTV